MLSLILSLRYIGESIQITTLGEGVGQKKEMGEGEERKKYFSLPNTSPAPYESAHCLDYFRIQHCGYTNKNNHTRRENVRNAGYMKAYGDNF